MAIQQGMTTAFKKNCLSGLENFASGTPYTYKIALYDANADLNTATTAYTTAHEITASGYTAGGKTLAPTTPLADTTANTAYLSFANVSWTGVSFTCRGALIYNATTGAAVCVLDFGADKTASGIFSINFPADTSSNAIIRFE